MSSSAKRSPSIEEIYFSNRDTIDQHHHDGSNRNQRSRSRSLRSCSRERNNRSHSGERECRHDDQKDISSSYGRPIPHIQKQVLPRTLPDELWTEELRELSHMRKFHYRYFRKYQSAEHEALYKMARRKLKYEIKQSIQQWMNGLNKESMIAVSKQQAVIREKRKECIEQRNQQMQQQRELEGWVTVESKSTQPQETCTSELETTVKSYNLPYRNKSKGFQTLRNKGHKSETESEVSNFSSMMNMLTEYVHEDSNNGDVNDTTGNDQTTVGQVQTQNYALHYSGSATANSKRHEVCNNNEPNISRNVSNSVPEKLTMDNNYKKSWPMSQNNESRHNFDPERRMMDNDYQKSWPMSKNSESTYNFNPERQNMGNDYDQSYQMSQNNESRYNFDPERRTMANDYKKSWPMSNKSESTYNFIPERETMGNDYDQSCTMSQNNERTYNFDPERQTMGNDYNQTWPV